MTLDDIGAQLAAALADLHPDVVVSHNDDPSISCGNFVWLIRVVNGEVKINPCIAESRWVVGVYAPLDCDAVSARSHVNEVTSLCGDHSIPSRLSTANGKHDALRGLIVSVGAAQNYRLMQYKTDQSPNTFYASVPVTVRRCTCN